MALARAMPWAWLGLCWPCTYLVLGLRPWAGLGSGCSRAGGGVGGEVVGWGVPGSSTSFLAYPGCLWAGYPSTSFALFPDLPWLSLAYPMVTCWPVSSYPGTVLGSARASACPCSLPLFMATAGLLPCYPLPYWALPWAALSCTLYTWGSAP